jgi:hypothetical protein
MSQRCSARDFFCNTPNAMHGPNFTSRWLLLIVDCVALKETTIDTLFDAWMALAELLRGYAESVRVHECLENTCPAIIVPTLLLCRAELPTARMAKLQSRV